MNLLIKNKVFVVSGSTRGIGKQIAKDLLEEGAKLIINGRNKKNLLASFKEMSKIHKQSIDYVLGDISNKNILNRIKAKALKKWQRIDGIVANVGNVKTKLNQKNEWNWFFENNFFVTVNFVENFIDTLKKSKGSIVFIGSIAGITDVGAPHPYAAAKSALHMYSKTLSNELSKFGIRVNSVCPGNVIFKKGNWEKKLKSNPKKIKKIIKEKVPLNIFGETKDISSIVVFLLSQKAKFITGSNFIIDGGQTNSI